MTQTAAKRITSNGAALDYTPTSAVTAGDVVAIGDMICVATQAIAANTLGSVAAEGVFDIPKNADVFTAGDAVYWNSAATDLGNNTGSADNASGVVCGRCVANAAANASYVRTKIMATKTTNTIAGSVTADDITASDTSLAITGKAGTASAAGGDVVVAGGAGNATYDGGAVSVTGGASGTGESTNGGAVAIAGGAATSAASGDGGAVTISGGAGPTVGNTGGAVTILSGAGDGTNGTAGAVVIDSSGTGATKGAVTIATNAASLTLGKMPRIPFSSVSAAGGNQATAGVLVEGVNLITNSDNSKGVLLPSCVNGKTVIVINMVTDKTLKVYPPTAKQVNNLGANNAITVAANTISTFYSEGANAWYGPSAAATVA